MLLISQRLISGADINRHVAVEEIRRKNDFSSVYSEEYGGVGMLVRELDDTFPDIEMISDGELLRSR